MGFASQLEKEEVRCPENWKDIHGTAIRFPIGSTGRWSADQEEAEKAGKITTVSAVDLAEAIGVLVGGDGDKIMDFVTHKVKWVKTTFPNGGKAMGVSIFDPKLGYFQWNQESSITRANLEDLK